MSQRRLGSYLRYAVGESRLGEDLHLVYAMTATLESIGVLVFRGEASIGLVDDFFSGPIVVSWRKLQNYFFDERRETGRETVGACSNSRSPPDC